MPIPEPPEPSGIPEPPPSADRTLPPATPGGPGAPAALPRARPAAVPAPDHPGQPATTHGIFAAQPVLPGVERPEDWQAHHQGVLESLSPEGYLEHDLAERIADLTWRLRRAARYDTALAERALAVAKRVAAGSLTALPGAAVPVDFVPSRETIDRVARYESHLSRQFAAALQRLEALQSRRLAPPPAGPLAREVRPGRPPRLYSPSHPRPAGGPEDAS